MTTFKHALGGGGQRQSGLTLIELMAAMVLGLVVAAGIITILALLKNEWVTRHAG